MRRCRPIVLALLLGTVLFWVANAAACEIHLTLGDYEELRNKTFNRQVCIYPSLAPQCSRQSAAWRGVKRCRG